MSSIVARTAPFLEIVHDTEAELRALDNWLAILSAYRAAKIEREAAAHEPAPQTVATLSAIVAQVETLVAGAPVNWALGGFQSYRPNPNYPYAAVVLPGGQVSLFRCNALGWIDESITVLP